MFGTFVALIISSLVIVILILHKVWEMKRGHTFISKDVLPKSDSLIKGQIEMHSKILVGGSKRGIKIISSVTKESVKHIFLICVHYFHDMLTRIIVKMKGKGIKHTKGVSFFLKRMEEGYDEEKSKKVLRVRENVTERDNNLENSAKVKDQNVE